MAKKQSANSAEIERLEKIARKTNKKLREAREAENEKRTLGSYRDYTKEAVEKHNELVTRHQGYDTNDKARIFGYASFDGALEGTLRWVRMEAVYAVERELPGPDGKSITMLKTVDGPVDVAQSPDEVFNEFDLVRFAYSKEQVNEMLAEQTRRENKIAERKQKAKDKEAKRNGHEGHSDEPTGLPLGGPDFKKVSDLVGADVPAVGVDVLADSGEDSPGDLFLPDDLVPDDDDPAFDQRGAEPDDTLGETPMQPGDGDFDDRD